MRLEFHAESSDARLVRQDQTETYTLFKGSFPRPTSEHMHVRHIMRFYIIRALHQQGEEEVYLLPQVNVDGKEMEADVLAIGEDFYILAICESDSVTESTEEKLEILQDVENVQVIVVHSQYGNSGDMTDRFESELESKKFRLLSVVPPPFDDVYEYDIWMFETTFRDSFSGE